MKKAGLAALMHGIRHYDDGGTVTNDTAAATPTSIVQSSDPALLAQLNSLHDIQMLQGAGARDAQGNYLDAEQQAKQNLGDQLQNAKTVQDWLNIAQQGDIGGQGAGSLWSMAHTNVQDLLNQNLHQGQDYADVQNAMDVNWAKSHGENISDPQFQQARQQYNALHGIGTDPNAAYQNLADYGNAFIAARDAKVPQYTDPYLDKVYAGTQGGVFGGPGGGWADTLKASGLANSPPPYGFDNWNQVFEYQNYLGMTPQLDAVTPTQKQMSQEFFRPKSKYEQGFEGVRSQLPGVTASPFGLQFASENTPGYDPHNYAYLSPTSSGALTDAYETLNPLTASLNPQAFQAALNRNKQSNYIFQDPNLTDKEKMDITLGKAIPVPEYGVTPNAPNTFKTYTGTKLKYIK